MNIQVSVEFFFFFISISQRMSTNFGILLSSAKHRQHNWKQTRDHSQLNLKLPQSVCCVPSK